ncbi:uncharacterized protein KZ484_019859 [Pholidichthys leucotaenia]
MEVLTKHGLTLNGEKCIFRAMTVKFVGFRLSTEGLNLLHSNIEAILQLPEPSCPIQFSSFLGMVNFYGRFIPRYSETIDPLHTLLKQDATWVWIPACSAAISELKT